MATTRLFVQQNALDRWLEDGTATLDGEVLRLSKEGRRFQVRAAVHVEREVSGQPDAANLVGKAKDPEQLLALGGELCAGSLVMGENAYEVREGFLGEPIAEPAAAKPDRQPADPSRDELAELADAFLRRR